MSNIKILIVDDEADIRDVLKDAAEVAGVEAVCFADAVDALANAGSYDQYCAVISDFKMPQMDGIEYCKNIRESHLEIPFILSTGFADKSVAIQGLNVGVSELIEKPIPADVLIAIIEKYKIQYVKKQQERENDLKELIGFFVDETKELYSDLEETLLRLQEVPLDPVIVDALFRKIHSVKGGASAIPGAELLAKLSHNFESRLSFIKNNHYQPTEEEVPVYLDAAALSLKLVDALKISFAEVATYEPAVMTMIDMLNNLPKDNSAASKISQDSNASAATPTKGLDDEHNQSFAEEEIMVKNSQLDHFMELAGELVILKNYYQALVQDLYSSVSDRRILNRIENFSQSMEKSTQGLQEHILEVRKVNLKKIAAKISRIVRQASKQLNKKVNFELNGADLKVDKSIATAIGASLTHMVRNSLDHGIELPQDRIEKGKPESGSVKIDFIENSGAIEVNIIDDGRGLNIKKIKEKALEKNLVSEHQLQNMTELQIAELIFLPGFSTADQVTDVSGRGVGMDAALSMVNQLDGVIRIESFSGQGSHFKIRIPFLQTVSVEKSLIVEADEMLLAIPIESVRQITKGLEVQITDLQSGLIANIGEQSFALVSFDQKRAAHLATYKEAVNRKMVLTVQAGNANFALLVDRVHYQTEAVTQALPPAVNRELYVLGTTILGDDQVAYVIDTEQLYQTLILDKQAA